MAINWYTYAGYHMVFSAEMTSSADMQQFDNTFANGDRTLWNNLESQWYQDYSASNFEFGGGTLTLKAHPDAGLLGGKTYSSGMISTHDTFHMKSGVFEIMAQTADNPGFWSAFWLLPEGQGWPEIDIVEQPNVYPGAYFLHTNTPNVNLGGSTHVGYDPNWGMHSYAAEIENDTVTYYYDHQPVAYMDNLGLNGEDFYMLANLAVGGWAGDAGGVSDAMRIDYIRAFSNDPGVPPTTFGVDRFQVALTQDPAGNEGARVNLWLDGQWLDQVEIRSSDAGHPDIKEYSGKFGPGQHVLTAEFVNDYWGGDGMDRNAHVVGASMNGIGQNVRMDLWSNGSQTAAINGNGNVF